MKKETIENIILTIFILLTPFILYIVIAFILWIFKDPLNLIDDIIIDKQTQYEKCVYEVNKLSDNFNDTVGATYATQDEPSKNIKELINQCMELNK